MRVAGVPAWVDAPTLLGRSGWRRDDDAWCAELDGASAADVAARLRGVGLGGALVVVAVDPPLSRDLVRAARADDARRRRVTSPGFSRSATRLDAEGRYSLTPEALAVALARRVVASGAATVVDAGCGAGGNTIAFASSGLSVVAIERDAARLADARHNARRYGVDDRVRWVHGDAVALVGRLRADALFVDPPWGEAWDRARTSLAAVPPLAEVLAAAVGRYARAWVKLPPSFDPAELPGFAFAAAFGVADGDRRRVKFVVADGPLGGRSGRAAV